MIDLTIKDIARIAGVSTATVSRVINKDPSVKKSTHEMVASVIADNNYVPNASARNLKSDKSHLIGLVVSNISNPHFSAMSQVIEAILWKLGYLLVVCSTTDKEELELSYLRKLIELRVDGLIINATNKNDAYISQLSNQIPVVLIERCITDSNFNGDTIISNNFHGIQMMVQHLIQLGHREIGIINSSLQVSTGLERYQSFKSAMSVIGIKVDENYPYRYDSQYFNEEGGMDGCRYLMNLDKRPSALIVSNNAMSIGVYKYLHMHGFSVPDDISVMSYGNIENSELYRVKPSYTTLSPHFVGEKAASLLLSRIGQTVSNREVVFEPTLVLSDSVKHIH